MQEWPEAMGEALAAAFLDYEADYFRKLVRQYPDKLRPFNLQPGADNRWSKSQLRAFVQFREAIGREEKPVRSA